MSNFMYDSWLQSQKISLGSILEFSHITTRLCGELIRQNLKAMSEFAQDSQAQFQTLSKTKDINEIFQTQGEWLSRMAPHAMERAEKLLDTVLDSASEYREWYESNLEVVRQQGKAMSEKTMPKQSKGE